MSRRRPRKDSKNKNFGFCERLHILGQITLERRRERGDLIQWYKINAKIDKVTWNVGSIIKAATGGHRERLCKESYARREQTS